MCNFVELKKWRKSLMVAKELQKLKNTHHFLIPQQVSYQLFFVPWRPSFRSCATRCTAPFTAQPLIQSFQVSILPTFYVQILRSYCWLTVFFTHSVSTCIKAVHRTLMKLSPGVNFTNIMRAAFYTKVFLHSFSLITVWICNFSAKEY